MRPRSFVQGRVRNPSLPALWLLLATWLSPTPPSLRAADATRPLPPGIRRLEAPGIHNLFAVATNLYSGSAPESDEAFAALARLGVRTVISVDGARPDVEAARRHGLRYVHVPHGYDGIGAELQARLIQATRVLPGPAFVHCHHGKHRGPSAAAIICLGNQGWDAARADAFLRAAGTATNYGGLYGTVRQFVRPTADQLRAVGPEFPEVARVPDLVASMVELDARWERLKSIRKAGYVTPPDSPDLVPAQEVVLLREHYREARRLAESVRLGPDFLARLEAAESAGHEAERLLREVRGPLPEADRAPLEAAFDRLGRDCTACHVRYRDARPR